MASSCLAVLGAPSADAALQTPPSLLQLLSRRAGSQGSPASPVFMYYRPEQVATILRSPFVLLQLRSDRKTETEKCEKRTRMMDLNDNEMIKTMLMLTIIIRL